MSHQAGIKIMEYCGRAATQLNCKQLYVSSSLVVPHTLLYHGLDLDSKALPQWFVLSEQRRNTFWVRNGEKGGVVLVVVVMAG